MDQKFVVFRSEIDLKAHMAEIHLGSSKLSRSQVKAMKRIDLSSAAGRSNGSSQVLNLSLGRDFGQGQPRQLSRSSSVRFVKSHFILDSTLHSFIIGY